MGEQISVKYTVLDTNILLLDAEQMLRYQDTVVVIPEIVIRELDGKKTQLGELGFQARKAARLLSSATFVTEKDGPLTIARTIVRDQVIEIVKTKAYPLDVTANDEKIVHIAELYARKHGTDKVTFITNDAICMVTAIAAGIKATDLKIVERISFDFTRKLEVIPDVFASLHNSKILDVVPDHQQENYNYVFYDAVTGQSKLAVIRNGLIKVIGKETEEQLRKQDVSPIGAEQLFLSHAIQSPDVDIVVCEARAGTGKTLVALSNAIAMVGRNSPYKQIIYVRASVDDVEKVEEVGFLSGNDEKMAVYYNPLHDALDFIVRQKYKNTPKKGAELEKYLEEQRTELISRCNITAMTGLGMRGRTFPNAIVIIDEFQNNSQPSAQKMITRAGDNTKYILIGSQRQIDNAYITKYNNALSVVLDEAAKPQTDVTIHAVQLNKVVRSKLTDWAEKVFSKEMTQ